MKSFIPWVGGKSKLLWLIHKLSPSRYSRFIDVFGGSGTVTLSRPIQPGCMEVYNDFNSDLTNLFCCVKNRTMALLLELGFLPLNTRDDFNVLYKFFSKEEFTDEQLFECLHTVVYALWSQCWEPSHEDSAPDPTERFIMWQSLQKDGSHAEPHYMTNILAKFKKLLRLVMVVEIHQGHYLKKTQELERWVCA